MKTKILIALICLFPIAGLQAKALTTTTLAAVGSGTVSGPCKQVTFIFSSDYTGNIAGVSFSFAAGGTLTLNAYQAGDSLDDIVYTVTAGTLRIITVK